MLAGGVKVSVKIAAGVAAVLAVICAAGFSARAAGSHAAPVSRSIVVVTTTADVVHGNTSSIAALNRKPARDGISLREALLAADRTGGSATVYVMFSPRLNGETIEVRSELPPIHRDHIVLEGVAPNGSPARITLDGRRTSATQAELLLIQASEVTVRWLRFTGVAARRNLGAAVVVRQGAEYYGSAVSPGPSRIANVQIVDDVFDNRGVNLPNTRRSGGNTGALANALMVGTDGVGGANTQISGVTIAGNIFWNFNNDACGVLEASSGDTANGVAILDNTFEQDAIPIELGVNGDSPRITGTRIIGNTIAGGIGSGGINLDASSSTTNGTIDRTLIEDNAIWGLQYGALVIGIDSASRRGGDVISNTQIVNNVIRADISDGDAGIYLQGGNSTSSSPSSVSNVTIENDTLVDDQPGTLFSAVPNGPGASGNQITGVTVRNTILWDPNGTPIPVYTQPPDVVMNSLISGPGWAGANGNINANPNFVNEPAGDYQLAAGSPAITAGTTIGAPAYDILGAARRPPPEIGAYEYGALPRPLLAVTLEQLGGSGTVTSSPVGISCNTTCDAQFEPGTTVTLTAKPDPRSRFLGWTGACSGKARCTISLNSATSVTARFAP
jgi:hypothetical protein